ncbi:PL29 family lyase N-terminal domain-containing protein [Parabacteroides sp. PF5-6]|uniref:PL29 family lyase N-terminal domain-containing protein n=1 Tax=Parabacteroides sp. PF5-6 TaxID=1742403 RepID=UPI002406C429|nr:PL29 family lyase N-terminal domain-containing protein [Parabacteroides sp. PF5-6]MDF9830056.1 hypothetical protein [Parabacteroides sp. PF5-6]
MRTTKYILGMILTAAVLLGGCKYDDTELWDAVNGQAARIAALEQWQTTVNSNISTLQGLVSALGDNDYITGVTPFASPEPGGYTITFSKSSPITLYHGTNGTNGKDGSTPIIGVEEYPSGSGVYYWTINGEWLTADGKKMAVTGEKGADGATPKLAIGSDGYWYISANGTATGKAPGTGWVSTGVKATGDAGESGGSGSGLFSSVDNSHPDYVTFTLANGTIINLPKHRASGIRFNRPEVFIINREQVIPYISTGTWEPTHVWAIDIPTEWKISVDMSDKTITITPPVTIGPANSGGTAKILVADGDLVTAMYELTLNSVSNNLYGSTYYENGKAAGMVYIPTGDSRDGKGRIISLEESNAAWAESGYDYDQTGCDSYTNGRLNMAAMAAYIRDNNDKSWSNFPAFEWIHTMNGGTANYTPDATGLWYFPAPADLQYLFCAASGKSLQTWGWPDSDNQTDYIAPFEFDLTDFNTKLTNNEGIALSIDKAKTYRLSKEQEVPGEAGKYYYMWSISFNDGEIANTAGKKYNKNSLTRAILAF